MSSIWVACHFLSMISPGDAANLTTSMESASANWPQTHVVVPEPCNKAQGSFCRRLPGEQREGRRISFQVNRDSDAVRQGNYILYPVRDLTKILSDMDLNDDHECTIPKNLMKKIAD